MTRPEILISISENKSLYYFNNDLQIKEIPHIKISKIDLRYNHLYFNEYDAEKNIKFDLLFYSKESLARHIKDVLYIAIGGEK